MPSLYNASVPPMIKNLNALSKFLEKGCAHPGVTEEQLLNSRLAPDMGNLIFQIHIATDFGRHLAVYAGKAQPVTLERNEKTMDELQERIKKTLKILEDVNESDFIKEDDQVTFPIMDRTLTFNGYDFTLNFVMPNLYFHTTTAYGLLRKEGVDVGKKDYLGAS